MNKMRVNRALISVSNKERLDTLVPAINKFGIEVVSTGGTANELEKLGVKVVRVENLPGAFPEMLRGRVKTLQPVVQGGILVKQDDESQLEEIRKYGIEAFQLVIVNFYPWEKKITEVRLSVEEIIEHGMDIGGPTMVTSGIKSYPYVLTVVDPNDYVRIAEELMNNEGCISEEMRLNMATKASFEVAWYRFRIWNWMVKEFNIPGYEFPDRLLLGFEKLFDLRCGENPHQQAAFYKEVGFNQPAIASARCVGGKPSSATNIMDLDAAWETVRQFDHPAFVVIKHGTICGFGKDLESAWNVDPASAFGGVIGFNGTVTPKIALEMTKHKIDGVVALAFTEMAQEVFAQDKNRKNTPLYDIVGESKPLEGSTVIHKHLTGGLIRQQADTLLIDTNKWEVKTGSKPTVEEWKWIAEGWLVLKRIKSNAIAILDKNGNVVGVGGDHVNRAGSAKIALELAGDNAKEGILLSDALIPFRDLVDLAAKYDIRTIVQTGGSLKDQEVIDAAEEHSMTMIFTGRRAFWH